MSKIDTMAKLPGLHTRSGVYQLRVVIPLDIRQAYAGRTKLIHSLKTTDRREAALLGAKRRAAVLEEFEDVRRALNPRPMASLTPDLGRILAERVRATILAGNDRLRGDGSAVLTELAAAARQPLAGLTISGRLPQPTAEPAAPLGGLSDAQFDALAGLNAAMEGHAALVNARDRWPAVLPLVDAEARKLGVLIDWQAPEARPVLLGCLRAYRAAWADVVRRDSGDVVPTPPAPALPSPGNPEAHSAMTLRQVFTRWVPSKPRKAASTRACELALELFEQQHGSLPVDRITRQMGDAFRTWLQQQGGSSKSARDRFTWIKTLLLYAHLDLEVIPRQPWAKLDIAHRTESKRRPWAPAELRTFFGLPIFQAYDVPCTTQDGADAAYWIPLIGLFTGATVSELAQMRVQDVVEKGGGHWLRITDEGEAMTTKNQYRVRDVPMHSELVRLGLLEYTAAMRERGSVSLWPRLKLRKDKPGGYFSEWFGKIRKAPPVGFGEHPDFHCLRHTVRTAMTEAGFDAAIKDRITGHTVKGSAGTTTYDHPEAILRAAVESIKYRGLELPRVYTAPAPLKPPRGSRAGRSKR